MPSWIELADVPRSVRPNRPPAVALPLTVDFVFAQIDIVLPCLDEAPALPWVLSRIPLGARAIVVDNGSTDGSAGIARNLAAQVVRCPQRGYGAACVAGLTMASAELVAFCDCDASIDPSASAGGWRAGRRRPHFPRSCPRSIVGAEAFHGRVRDGHGWVRLALATDPTAARPSTWAGRSKRSHALLSDE